MIKHGEIGKNEWAHARWCDVCGRYHGILYRCEHYGEAILAEIKADTESNAEKLRLLEAYDHMITARKKHR